MRAQEIESAEREAAAIGANIARLRHTIAGIAEEAGRSPDSVDLHGATKGVDARRIAAAIRHGLLRFGENWVQEAAPKIRAVNELTVEASLPAPQWRMIGHLQQNKVNRALEVFDAIDTVDSLRLAQVVSRRAGISGREKPVDVLLEIDFTGARERAGFKLGLDGDDARLPSFMHDARRIMALPNLRVVGLMTVGPMAGDPEAARPGFRRLREVRDALAETEPRAALTHLSMGMSGDYEAAIQEGATIVRLGSAIFGPRPAGRTY